VKKSLVIPAVAILAVAIGLAGCVTAKPSLIAPAESAIRVEESGFAPQGGAEHASLVLEMMFGNPETIKSWTVSILSAGSAVRSWTGTSQYVPASLSWNGTDDNGSDVPEGTYTARLSIEYEKTYQPVNAESTSFVVDRTPPTGTVALNPTQFVPSDQGVTGPMTLTINADSKMAALSSWTLDVFDIAGGLVKSFSGEWPTNTATWDGSSLNGGFVAPAMTYKAVATVRDEFGLSSDLKVDVPVAEIPLATEKDLVQVRAAGFSPASTTLPKTIDIVPTIGNVDALKAWKVSIVHKDAGVQRTWSGDANNMPKTLSWDGRVASGILAPEGSYSATLSIDYGKSFQPVLVRSGSFILDITPPSGNVSANPAKLAADGKGGIQPVTFTLYGNATAAPLESWTLSVLDSSGKPAASYRGNWPPSAAVWDGSLASGGNADPTKTFTYVAQLRDVFGNVGEARGSLATGELPAVQGVVAVTPKAPGFSPNGDQVADAMSLSIAYGQPSAVSAWKLAIASDTSRIVRTYTGDGKDMPTLLNWDGKTDQGAVAADGSYTASLTVSYGTVFFPASSTSSPFLLVTAAPTGAISLSDPLFSPIEGSNTITLMINASSKNAAIDSWSMDVKDPGGNIFRSFSGKWPQNSVTWDGRGVKGDLVQSAEDYQVMARVRDQFGNTALLKTMMPVDILMEKLATGYRILASRIFFQSFTADYVDVASDLAQQNAARLDALAQKLSKFPDYKIRIVGHAVMIYWDNPILGKAEQKDVLIPLSKARADAVMKALVERGLDPSRFTTEGVGASDQLVPDSDLQNRWQNRRVALFLEKQ
jgi:flagellar hook assembly protein FlgD